jgi:hypothetical protein
MGNMFIPPKLGYKFIFSYPKMGIKIVENQKVTKKRRTLNF